MLLLSLVNIIGNCFLFEYMDDKWQPTAGNLLTLTGMTYQGMFSPSPHTSGNNMPDIATSPPRRERVRGLWFSLARMGAGIGSPLPAGPTPTAVVDTPPGRGRGLRSSPPRRVRGLWNPQSRRKEV